jgi:hypothetical protein
MTSHILCGIKCPTHPGREQKYHWLQANAKFGLRVKALLAPDGQPSGYIEYLPGEFAWVFGSIPGSAGEEAGVAS